MSLLKANGGGLGGAGAPGGALGSSSIYSHTINQSLRCEDGDTAWLQHTSGAASSTYTLSMWFKRGNLSTYQYLWSSGNNGIGFDVTTNRFYVWIGSGQFSTARFLDTNAWYHVTYINNSNSASVYINGVELMSGLTGSTLSTATNATNIARYYSSGSGNYYFDGYIAEVHFVADAAKAATDFGEFVDGVWVPKEYTGSHGSHGYYLPFDDSSAIGDDKSANTNDFTVTDFVASDVVPDSPTNNFATYNILVNTGQSLTYEEGNLNNSASGSFWSTSVWQQSSLGITGGANAGKYYFEYCTTTSGSGQATGVAVQSSRAIDTVSHNDGVIYYNTAVKTGNTVTVSGISNNPTYDVLRFAFDASNGKVWIGNSTGWFNSGDPAAGTGESGTIANYDGSVLHAVTNRTTITSDHIFNFGQDSTFAGFKASGSANGSDANGIGDFYYDPPTGFLAMCSSNLPSPVITDGSEHFTPYIYTANNASTRSFTGLGFQADFLWLKPEAKHLVIDCLIVFSVFAHTPMRIEPTNQLGIH